MAIEGQQDREADGRLRAAWVAAMVVGYVAAALYLVYLSCNQINPDGLAYIQNARHYAHGRLDLAVNSFWGPLLSWFLVPFVWLHVEETLAAKALGVLLGLVFAAGVQSLAWRMGLGRHRTLCFAAALLLALPMLPEPKTPDLLLASLLAWYLAISVDVMWKGGGPRSAAAGAIGGLAYLAKAYAFPFVLAHLCLTFFFKYRLLRRGGAQGGVRKPLLLAVAGFALVACPWVSVISAHDRQITIGSSARLARAWFSPVYPKGPRSHPPISLQVPREGRMFNGENPVEMPYPSDAWSPFDGVQGMKLQLITIVREGSKALRFLKDADSLGMIMGGCVIALCMIARLGVDWARKETVSCLWALGTVGVYVLGYVNIYAEARFFWAIWGLMLVVSVWAISTLTAAQRGHAPVLPRQVPWHGLVRYRATEGIVGLILLLSLGYTVLTTTDEWRGSAGGGAEGDWRRQMARTMGITGQCVTNSRNEGLYVSYWADSRFLGEFKGSSSQAVAQEIAPFGRSYVLVFDDPGLSEKLSGSPAFRRIGESRNPRTGGSLGAFLFDSTTDAAMPASR